MKGNLRLSFRHIFPWNPRGKRIPRAVMVLCVLVTICFLFAFQEENESLAYQVAAIPQDGEVLLLEEWGELCLFAYGEGSQGPGTLLALNRKNGQAQARYSTGQRGLLWADVRGDSLFLVECQEDSAYLTQLSLPNLQTENTRLLPVAPEGLAAFDCDGEGSFYFADPSLGNSLWVSGADGSLQQISQVSSVSFLEITREGTLFAVSGIRYYWGPAQTPASWKNSITTFQPQYLLGEGYFVSKSYYRLCGYGQGSLTQLNSLSLPTDSLLCAFDREDHLLYAASANTLKCASLSGESLDSVSLRGTLLAVCGSGAIIQEDGYYWFSPVVFFQESQAASPGLSPIPSPPTSPDLSPFPSPSTSPSLSPFPSPSTSPSLSPSIAPQESFVPEGTPALTPPPTPEGIVQEGEYLVMSMDVTLSQLLSYFVPDAVPVYRPDGTEVTSGHLATGMTVEGYTLVVLGDCDGSGTLSKGDLRAAQDLLLDQDQKDSPYFRAADLDGDGAITTLDLILLSHNLSS